MKTAASPTDSYYMWTIQDVWGLGCSIGTELNNVQGIQDVFVFLDFGNPNQDSQGRLGTVMYSLVPKTDYEIASAVVIFSSGFYYCSQNDLLTIAVGTNSSGGLATDVIAYRHGEAWANLIIEINDRFLAYEGLSSRVLAVAGNNIEPNFNPFYVPDHWLDGYHSVTDPRRQIVYNIGSADDCPVDYPPSTPGTYVAQDCYMKYQDGTLVYKWTQEDVYYVSWGAPLAWPFPEIYNSTTVDQWYRISLYTNFNHYGPMFFRGTITQFGACDQQGGCPGADFDPGTGFTSLYSRIQNDQYTLFGNKLKWSTDISNYHGP